MGLRNSAFPELRILSLEAREGMGLQDRNTSEAQGTDRNALQAQLPQVSSFPQY